VRVHVNQCQKVSTQFEQVILELFYGCFVQTFIYVSPLGMLIHLPSTHSVLTLAFFFVVRANIFGMIAACLSVIQISLTNSFIVSLATKTSQMKTKLMKVTAKRLKWFLLVVAFLTSCLFIMAHLTMQYATDMNLHITMARTLPGALGCAHLRLRGPVIS